jgi:dTDP-4-dehydrorhamnose reductase
MRLLLLGKNGQLGWELQRVLAPGAEVIALARNELDLSRPEDIHKTVRSLHPDAIVNAAAYTAVDRAEQEEELAFAINAQAPAALAAAAAALGVPLIHFSTDYVFDGTRSGPYAEGDRTNPLGAYGRSKLAGELEIAKSGCAHLIFRTSWVYGARGKNFLLTMLDLARSRPELRVVHDQLGVPTWSRMVAEVTGAILASSRRDLPSLSGTYHLAAAGQTCWHGFAERIVALGAGMSLCPAVPVIPISTAEYPTATRRPLNSALLSDKLATAFGLRIPDWDTCLRWCMEDLRAYSSR